jgi:hypothetical protein
MTLLKRVDLKTAFTSDILPRYSKRKFVSHQTRTVAFCSQSYSTPHPELRFLHFYKVMTSNTELATSMNPPRRFPTVETVAGDTGDGNGSASEDSQKLTTMSTSGSSGTIERIINSPNTLATQSQSQETAVIILAALPKHTKPQLMDAATEMASTEKSQPSSVTRDHQATCHSPVTSDSEHNAFQGPSPETVSSIFPSELPPRPPQKPSFLHRLNNPFAHPNPANKSVSHDHTHRTPDIEMGVRGEAPRSHEVDQFRSHKFWGLMLLGACLSTAIGMVIYYLVVHVQVTD